MSIRHILFDAPGRIHMWFAQLVVLAAAAPSSTGLATELPEFRAHAITTSLKTGYQLVVADLNGDGRKDVIALDERATELAWFENPGWRSNVLAVDVPRPINADCWDVDGDGTPEVALAFRFETDPDKSIGNFVILMKGSDIRQPWIPREIDRVPTTHRVRWIDPGPDIDAELIMLSARLLKAVGLERVQLHLNSLGTPESRRAYRSKLVEYFTAHRSRLDADSLRRLEGNPLRILDSKNPELQALIAAAPVLTEYLDEESRRHFAVLCRHLDAVGIGYVLDPRLVRGLDYYSHTVFEWLTTELGSQGAVCSGGRYDGLVAQLGGESTPAVGWALGQERIVELLRVQNRDTGAQAPDVYMVIAGESAEAAGLPLAESLRDALPGVKIETNCGGGSFKTQLKRADKSGARFALILGDAETEERLVGLKSLRVEAPQEPIAWDRIADALRQRLAAGS